MKPRVYIETTIPSYLAAWPSRNLIRAAHQQLTRAWWEDRRGDFDLFVSQLVVRECQAGDSLAAAKRLELLDGIHSLEPTADASLLANQLVARVPLPHKAALDALHVAIATVNDIQYLLTWNCRHLANASLRKQIESVCREGGYEPPIICTPEELLKRIKR
jgi:hypothetical protein